MRPPTTLPPVLTADVLRELKLDAATTGIIIVDHGSRRDESNAMLLDVADAFQRVTNLVIVQPAHMELAEPSISTAFDRCVQQGARLIVVFPYFLGPGRHWRQDIPNLAAAAAARHPQIRYLVAAPLGLHPLMQQIMQERVLQCLRHTLASADPCDACQADVACQMLPSDASDRGSGQSTS